MRTRISRPVSRAAKAAAVNATGTGAVTSHALPARSAAVTITDGQRRKHIHRKHMRRGSLRRGSLRGRRNRRDAKSDKLPRSPGSKSPGTDRNRLHASANPPITAPTICRHFCSGRFAARRKNTLPCWYLTGLLPLRD